MGIDALEATGDVDGIGWLEARGRTLIEALETLQALAAQRVAEPGAEEESVVSSSLIHIENHQGLLSTITADRLAEAGAITALCGQLVTPETHDPAAEDCRACEDIAFALLPRAVRPDA